MNRNKQSISLGGCAGGTRQIFGRKPVAPLRAQSEFHTYLLLHFVMGKEYLNLKRHRRVAPSGPSYSYLHLARRPSLGTAARGRNECKCSVSGHSKRAAIPDTAPLKEETARKKEMANEKAVAGRARRKAVCAECGFRILASACGE